MDLPELKSLLRTNRRLPKDAYLKSSKWGLPSNPHIARDRHWERALLKALIAAGSSKEEQRQALEQANCTPKARCRRPTCWFCKHRAWRKFRRKLARVLKHGVPPETISWVTIVIGVCEPAPEILDQRKVEFHSFLQKAVSEWDLMLFGRYEVDLIQLLDLKGTSFKRGTLLHLGLNRADKRKLVAVLHVHLIAHHPKQTRAVVSLRLKQTFRGPRRTNIQPLRVDQAQAKALDNVTRYTLKSRPPQSTLQQGTRSVQLRNPKALRLYNKILNTFAGKKGECIFGGRTSKFHH